MDALRTGAAQPAQEQMGHRVDLSDAMRGERACPDLEEER